MGNNIGSYPKKIKLILNDKNLKMNKSAGDNQLFIGNVSSGNLINIQLSFYDEFNDQIVYEF